VEAFGKEPAWAVVELFGHIRHAGLVQEVTVLGATMGRVDVPDAKDPAKTHATHFFAGSAVFRITPCTEELARRVAGEAQGVWTNYQLPSPREHVDDAVDDVVDELVDEPEDDGS
jgi:hypothetical protein